MKMILAILSRDDEMKTVDELNKAQFFVTKLSTTGGFLKKKNTTILIGTEDERVQEAIELIRANAKKRTELRCTPAAIEPNGSMEMMPVPLEVEVGGCTIFVFPVEQMGKY